MHSCLYISQCYFLYRAENYEIFRAYKTKPKRLRKNVALFLGKFPLTSKRNIAVSLISSWAAEINQVLHNSPLFIFVIRLRHRAEEVTKFSQSLVTCCCQYTLYARVASTQYWTQNNYKLKFLKFANLFSS